MSQEQSLKTNPAAKINLNNSKSPTVLTNM